MALLLQAFKKFLNGIGHVLGLAEVMVTSRNSNVIRQVLVTSNNLTSNDVTSREITSSNNSSSSK